MKKITLLDNMVQAHVLEALLKEQGIPHLVVSYHCSAYDGIFQDQKGWGHLEAPEEHEAEILKLIEQLKNRGSEDPPPESPESDSKEAGIDPRHGRRTIKSERPWGDVHMVVRNQTCSVDLTHVRPGHRSSLHSHDERHELFHFLDDGARLEIDGKIHRPGIHDDFLIAPGQKHRFWAEDTPFRMLVISFGAWRADDQTRHEDDYGREGRGLER